ncbi:hypothetical protein A2533_01345 [Candidatus Falkowbacteria bacterium RIFOXYD2_FULL_35_9]|uniref:YprB ribonuclease H-like domain-containing protein n=1 Tax=Candidatus Falkowbacteria bacterium RIFOXYC2_FULL_36_12 TaxID=1798002 RepID=A0A1F5T051_9BACT|nr:MAG: hypothetical protein A2300_01040 [Candidatus Falkowbacteria bacterium RIFOXYB2_FULL_35_7]OGF32330.1 MAG: hypothetical protein A2478_03340 [Candidatus Falkowbacteria bacterium RIFOXYC2_FULL_36_12]OGF34547.1 MAG: hypothetical protein A2223_00845 [Candidatus Falkowbacteria bacterium RIFOXYA2_FULL_35_8]OGF47248.1 MAG: hypothetical protein A2533_01345 [Candidatus Falkowbacteria bacterium RIFOXYD2_FULL_35_9]
MKKIVFDIETKNSFAEVGNNISGFEISVVGLYDSERDVYESYFEQDFVNLWPILEQADMLIGFNSNSFDIPILNKYYSGDLTKIKSLDILQEIYQVMDKRTSLDSIAEATLGVNKSGHGLQAIEWWKSQELEKLKNYCLDDVKITKQIYDFTRENNFLLYTKQGEIRKVQIDATNWEKKLETKINLTLPI